MASAYGDVRYGDTGDSVRELQKALNNAGYNLAVDGVYGDKTLGAVKSYQTANGLTADGVVSSSVWGILNGAAVESSGSPSSDAAGASSGLSDALEKLIAQYSNSAYTPQTDEERRAQAEGEYASYYDQLEGAAQREYERNDLALQQQREGLAASYDKQREASKKEYDAAYSQSDRQMLSRGMQRSSYGAQTLANISTQGAEAQQAIYDEQAAAESNIDQQRTLLAQQLAQQLSQYSANEAADVLARIRELEQQDYERGMTASEYQSSLAAQIYQFLYQAEQDKISNDQWQQEFDAAYGDSGGSGYGYGSGSGSGNGVPEGYEDYRAYLKDVFSFSAGMEIPDWVKAASKKGDYSGSSLLNKLKK